MANDVRNFEVTASANTAAAWGWPENMAASQVNNSARENLGALARWFKELRGAYTSSFTAGTYTVHVDASPATAAHLSLLTFRTAGANSGTASLQIITSLGGGDTLTSYHIKQAGQHLAANDLRTGQVAMVLFNEPSAHYELFNTTQPGTQLAKRLSQHSSTASVVHNLGISPQGYNMVQQSTTAAMQGALGIGTAMQSWVGHSTTGSMLAALGMGSLVQEIVGTSSTATLQNILSITPQAATVLTQSTTASMQYTLGMTPQTSKFLSSSSTASMQYNIGLSSSDVGRALIQQSTTAALGASVGMSDTGRAFVAQSSTAGMLGNLGMGSVVQNFVGQSTTAQLAAAVGISDTGRAFVIQSSTAGMLSNLGLGTSIRAFLGASSTASQALQLGISPQAQAVLLQSTTASLQASLGLEAVALRNEEGTWSAQQYFETQTLAPAGSGTPSVSWGLQTSTVAYISLSGNYEMAAPTNMRDGGVYELRLKQAVGSNTMSWNAVFLWDSGVAPVLSTTASNTDILVFTSDGTSMFGRSFGLDFS